ncbi:MAG: phosphoribosyltransferase family protein [Patescibacteria group bacterium]|mgnify:CR=1 FL=1
MNVIAQKYYEKSEGEVALSWDDVEASVRHIIHQMKEDGFVPDMIVSIARSGLIPASLIAYSLGNKELYVIKVDFSNSQKVGKDQDLRAKPVISQELSKDVQGLRVLVVDEMVVSGQTLKLVSAYMAIKDPKEIKYAVLYKQPWAEFQPDYFGKEIREWPVYPWKVLNGK